MEVTFTIEALASINSGVSARTNKAVEIKFTFITCIQVAASVSRTPKRSPLGPFGEMPALLTMAANLPPLSLLRTMSAKASMLSMSAKSACMWFSRPDGHMQRSEKGWRDTVRISQPCS